ncbi:MAG: hypothetical protein WAN36_12715 [Calditrichia bacterium]
MKKFLVVLLITLTCFSLLYSAENVGKSKVSFNKPTILEDYWVDANRMNGVYRNNGIWLYDVVAGDWGLEWPKGSGLSPVFAAGQWVGARYQDEIRVAGIQHSATEFQPGVILDPFNPSNPTDPAYQWYELHPGGVGDWTRWPVDQGAPLDENGNPQLRGDVTIFSVWNDLAPHTEYGTNKLSVEVQQTVWAYNRADALGDMQFIKWRLVNKSGVNWDSTYFSIWMDPDVGDAGDDFVGSDTTLGLGYSYNADNDDQTYGAAPPAVGIDFFQGPLIDNPDSTVVLPDGTTFQGKEMLKMTSFVFYNNDDSPQGNPSSGNDVWNFFRGYWRDGSRITDPQGNPTSFMFTGDPEDNSGWLDQNEADRRFLMTTGPFPMEAWEDVNGDGLAQLGEPGVQDIVAGVILARGDDNLNSVTTLKTVDGLAQLAYDLNFNLAAAPLPPDVAVSEKSNEVILTWDDMSEFNEDGTPYSAADPIVGQAYGDTVIINNVETIIDDSTYNFYGYSVYQYSDASGRDPVLIGHWDTGGTLDATPYTAQRYMRILTNKNPVVGNVGAPLVNGKEYYFGVVAEGYLEYGAPKVFESAASIVTAIPQPIPGQIVHSEFNDTLEVEHGRIDVNVPLSDGSVVAWVVDPTKVTGDEYKVEFDTDNDGNMVWDLIDTTTGDTVLNNQTNQRGDNAYTVVDGLMVKVQGPAPGIKEVIQVDPADWTEVLDSNLNFSLGYLFDDTDPRFYLQAQGNAGTAASNLARWDWQGNMTPNDYVIEFVENPETEGQMIFSGWASDVDPQTGSWLLRGWISSDTLGGDTTFHDTGRLPFKIWKITPDGVRTQVNAMTYDDGDDWYWNPHRDTQFADGNGFDRIYVVDYPYDEAEILADGGHVLNDIMWGTLWNSGHSLGRVEVSTYTYADGPFAGSLAGMPPAPGTVMRFNTNKPNTTNDFYTFTAPTEAEITQNALATDIDKINVVPNPYYGYHSGEMNPFERWVQFTYLPPKCTIRIFDLAGNIVRVLQKNDATTTLMKWDMQNEYQLPVASGIYVYQVEVPGVGEKIGKLAIFTPNERLDTY